MGFIKNKQKINDINAYLLIAFAFVLPLSVAGANIIDTLIILLWIVRGTYKDDWNELKNNKVVLAFIGFYLLHVVGLLWTEDIQWGLHILKKETKMLYLPIFMLFVRKEHIKYYIYAFLLAMSLSEILSYGVWFEIIPEFKNATVTNPTPFMSHISYNPLLAFTIYLISIGLLFDKGLDRNKKFLYAFFIFSMTINMFITGGRAGQVMFFTTLVILFFQFYWNQKFKAVLLTMIVLPTIFLISYNTSALFKARVDSAISDVKVFKTDANSSVGHRLTFAINSWEIIKDNPLIGVGTGDFALEYKKVNEKNTPNMPNTSQPHNMYTLDMVQFGILGLISLLSILYFQFRHAMRTEEPIYKYIGMALPLLFGVVMLSDSYLLGHYTGMLFIFFSSFLYKRFDSNTSRQMASTN